MANTKFKTDETLYTIGINMKGKHCITTATFVEYKTQGMYDCVVKTNSGFKMKSNSSEYFRTHKEAKQALADC